jgi:hypothetical protein
LAALGDLAFGILAEVFVDFAGFAARADLVGLPDTTATTPSADTSAAAPAAKGLMVLFADFFFAVITLSLPGLNLNVC